MGSSPKRNRTHVSHVSLIGRQILIHCTPRDAPVSDFCEGRWVSDTSLQCLLKRVPSFRQPSLFTWKRMWAVAAALSTLSGCLCPWFCHLCLQIGAQPWADVTLQSSFCLSVAHYPAAPSRIKLPEDRHSCVFSCTGSFPGSCNTTLHTAHKQWTCLLIWVWRKTSDSESGVWECF